MRFVVDVAVVFDIDSMADYFASQNRSGEIRETLQDRVGGAAIAYNATGLVLF